MWCDVNLVWRPMRIEVRCNFAITMNGWDLKLQKAILDLNYRIKNKRKSKKVKVEKVRLVKNYCDKDKG